MLRAGSRDNDPVNWFIIIEKSLPEIPRHDRENYIFLMNISTDLKTIQVQTVSPQKHGNSVTISNWSSSAQLGSKINVWRACGPASKGKVD